MLIFGTPGADWESGFVKNTGIFWNLFSMILIWFFHVMFFAQIIDAFTYQNVCLTSENFMYFHFKLNIRPKWYKTLTTFLVETSNSNGLFPFFVYFGRFDVFLHVLIFVMGKFWLISVYINFRKFCGITDKYGY